MTQNLKIKDKSKKWTSYEFQNNKEFINALLSENDEKVKEEMLSNTGYFGVIKFIKNPSERLQEIAISKSLTALSFIDNPSPNIIKKVITQHPSYISLLKKPNEETQLLALENEGSRNVFDNIKNPTLKVKIQAITKYPQNIQKIKKPSQKMQDIVLNQSLENFRYIHGPSKKSQMAFIRHVREKKTIQYNIGYNQTSWYFHINHIESYDSVFLKMCYDLVDNKRDKNHIKKHKDFTDNPAKMILNELTSHKNKKGLC